ncbi:MAG: hypothetical protein NT099_02310 [Candidatus Saganbacteria bacterium]|nr:hypothetical protein [Candidatus Saganbacteria bacterium]
MFDGRISDARSSQVAFDKTRMLRDKRNEILGNESGLRAIYGPSFRNGPSSGQPWVSVVLTLDRDSATSIFGQLSLEVLPDSVEGSRIWGEETAPCPPMYADPSTEEAEVSAFDLLRSRIRSAR